MAAKGPSIVMIGGGTGTYTVLSALKHYVRDITAVVNMVDDGGSTGVLRDEFGTLPPGDVRQALVALSSSPELLRQLFNYRFDEGSLGGHAFGNLFLTALEKITGSFTEAVRLAGEVLAITGRVMPVTTDNVRLHARLASGGVVEGERAVTKALFAPDARPVLFLEPRAKLNPEAATAIKSADVIILGPGNLYSSLIPNLLVDGLPAALIKSKAKKVYICNLVTKPGQTADFEVHDFVEEIEGYIDKPVFDYVIYNTAAPSPELLAKYAKDGELPVEFDQEVMKEAHYQAIGEDLVAAEKFAQDPNDKFIKRTLIRHDSDKLARLIMRLYFS